MKSVRHNNILFDWSKKYRYLFWNIIQTILQLDNLDSYKSTVYSQFICFVRDQSNYTRDQFEFKNFTFYLNFAISFKILFEIRLVGNWFMLVTIILSIVKNISTNLDFHLHRDILYPKI